MNKISTVLLVIILILIAVAIYFLVRPESSVSQDQQSPNQQTSTSYDIQGMKVEILTQGSGATAKSGDTVTVNYVGTLQDGTKFDSSIDRGQPFEFTLGQNSVIQGWELGVAGMKVGEKRKLTIPPELGYGSQGAGGVIPPNATLLFEIDLLGINK
jgi:FKBP-type peptidyl-prolyl cis-trans isomerase